jgi:hypothetical protein
VPQIATFTGDSLEDAEAILALCCRLSADRFEATSGAGNGRIKIRRYSRDGLSWTVMLAGHPTTMYQSAPRQTERASSISA